MKDLAPGDQVLNLISFEKSGRVVDVQPVRVYIDSHARSSRIFSIVKVMSVVGIVYAFADDLQRFGK